MYASYEGASLWPLLQSPPQGLRLDFVKAERSSFRWAPAEGWGGGGRVAGRQGGRGQPLLRRLAAQGQGGRGRCCVPVGEEGARRLQRARVHGLRCVRAGPLGGRQGEPGRRLPICLPPPVWWRPAPGVCVCAHLLCRRAAPPPGGAGTTSSASLSWGTGCTCCPTRATGCTQTTPTGCSASWTPPSTSDRPRGGRCTKSPSGVRLRPARRSC
jgi:hypothetical protein